MCPHLPQRPHPPPLCWHCGLTCGLRVHRANWKGGGKGGKGKRKWRSGRVGAKQWSGRERARHQEWEGLRKGVLSNAASGRLILSPTLYHFPYQLPTHKTQITKQTESVATSTAGFPYNLPLHDAGKNPFLSTRAVQTCGQQGWNDRDKSTEHLSLGLNWAEGRITAVIKPYCRQSHLWDHPGLCVLTAGKCGRLYLWVKIILKNSCNNGEWSCDLWPNRLPGGLRRGDKLLFKLAPLFVQQSYILHRHGRSADGSPSFDLQLLTFIFFPIQCWCIIILLSS